MISVYTQYYNIEKYSIDFQTSLRNFSKFAKEVIVAVNQSEDDTLRIIEGWIINEGLGNVHLIKTFFSYDDIEFDGKVKNEALQHTSYPIKIQMDGDEVFDLNQKEAWLESGLSLLQNGIDYYGLLIPSIDVWGDINRVRNVPQGYKVRMHKSGVRRGVHNAARLENGKLDTSKTDTTEPILPNGDIASFIFSCDPKALSPERLIELRLFTVHLGYLNFNARVEVNKFWGPHWEARSGKIEKWAKTKTELSSEETVPHNLNFRIE